MTQGQGVRSLSRGLHIIELIAEKHPIRLNEIASRLGEPKSSVLRLLQTMDELGWVARTSEDNHAWVLTPRVGRLASRIGPEQGLSAAALPVMESLRDETNETIHLAVAEVPNVLLVERVESMHHVRYVEPVGGLAPMTLTATGRASLSAMPDDFITSLIDNGADEADTPSSEELMQLIHKAREDGYATTSAWRDGVFATAAPVIWADCPMPPPAMSISAPNARVDDETKIRHAKLVIDAVHQIARRL